MYIFMYIFMYILDYEERAVGLAVDPLPLLSLRRHIEAVRGEPHTSGSGNLGTETETEIRGNCAAFDTLRYVFCIPQ